MYYLALCTVVRDEDALLPVWIAYHALRGVEHFFIYDNQSKNSVQQLVQEKFSPQLVTVIPIAGPDAQLRGFRSFVSRHGSACRWAGLLDPDEFVCCRNENDIRILLSEFEEYGALCVPWKLFTSSGHLSRPAGPVIENYIEAVADGIDTEFHVKSFVHPAYVTKIYNPHRFLLQAGRQAVNADHVPIPLDMPFTWAAESADPPVRLNHYFTRSQQDWEEKCLRGRPNNQEKRSLARFYELTSLPVRQDASMRPYLAELKAALQSPLPLKARMPALPTSLSHQSLVDNAERLIQQGKIEQARVLLCHAAMYFGPTADICTLRARADRLRGRLERAERFLRLGMRGLFDAALFLEMACLRLAQGRRGESGQLLGLVRKQSRYLGKEHELPELAHLERDLARSAASV